MDKVMIRIKGDAALFDEVASEAARLDRSPSYLFALCLGKTLPKLDASVLTVPRPSKARSTDTRSYFVPREIIEKCGRLAARLGISNDDLLAWAWQAGRDSVRALPTS
jgi:hypothetical protein